MRLLSPEERDNAEEKEKNRIKDELDTVNQALTDSVKSFNEFEARSQIERRKIELKHSKFVLEKRIEIETLERIVSELESRKREALRPLDDKKRTLDSREKIANEREESLRLRESAMDIAEMESHNSAENYRKKLDDILESEWEFEKRRLKMDEEKRAFENSMERQRNALRENRRRLREYFEKKSRELDQKINTLRKHGITET